ncbi:ECF RNA polymerase sigma factor SigE [Gemmata obscuriglobus]|nr:sigma-70 family RNA polymerase sigma factor [Gemmata obscuriglobus]QEG27338.1 ECF RNA polymerase sigma factor SigE [Gemmata obscuriglobus]VTS04191.1 (myosin heavy-chain) kinase : Uncultured bacterium genome assembly Metasoil_fosmids_resub OS=uncultured bacterium PE=4 SV=1: Sigma70_r2: Sigma70_r4_2: PD40: WD40 [Gemmata obscuriglobus UQM 2246]
MSATAVRRVVSRLQPGGALTDAELVLAIGAPGTSREAAFAELVGRYGPMVLGVCRRVLGDAHAAEDAFQAVFLVLARKAELVRPPGAVGGWLYGVAVRTARKAKVAAARRRRYEMAVITPANVDGRCVAGALDHTELRAVIDEELAALPETHRAAIVLCDLQGKTRAEAACELGRAEGTVASWLARGRKALAVRLARRGVALPAAGLLAVAVPFVVSAELSSVAVGTLAGRGASPFVLALAESVMKSFAFAPKKLFAGACAVGALLAAVATAAAWPGRPPVPDLPATPPTAVAAPVPKPEAGSNGFLDHDGRIHSVSYAPGGKAFVSVGGGRAVVWEAGTQKRRFSVPAEFAAFSADGKSLFVLAEDEFRTLDAGTGKVQATKKRDKPEAIYRGTTAAFTADGSKWVEFDGNVHHLRGDFKGGAPALAGQRVSTRDEYKRIFGRGGAFSPDGTRFAGIHWKHAPEDANGVLSVWDAVTGVRTGALALPNSEAPAFSFAWSPDGTELAVGRYSVEVYDAKTLKLSRRFDAGWEEMTGRFSALAWSPDGKRLAAGRRVERSTSPPGRTGGVITGDTANVQLLDARTGAELQWFDGFPDNLPVMSLAFSPDGKRIVCGAGNFPDVIGFDPPAGAKTLRVLNVEEPSVRGMRGVAFGPDGSRYIVFRDGIIEVFDAATGKPLYTAGGEAGCLLADNGLVVLEPRLISLYDARGHRTAGRRPPNTKAKWEHAVFSPDGKRYALHFGQNVRVYDIATGAEAFWLEGQLEASGMSSGHQIAPTVQFTDDGKGLIVSRVKLTADGPLGAGVWSATDGKRLDTFVPNGKEQMEWAVPAPSGGTVAISFGTRVEIWATGNGAKNPVHRFASSWRVDSLAYSPDGTRIAVGSRKEVGGDGGKANRVRETVIQVFNATTGKEQHRFAERAVGRDCAALHLAFAPNGNQLLAGFSAAVGPGGAVKLYDVTPPAPAVAQDWAEVATLTDLKGNVNGVAVSPDGKLLAATDHMGMIAVWDAKTRKVLATVNRATKGAYGVAFSRDNKHLAVGSDTGVLGYELPGTKLAAWSENNVKFGRVSEVAFSPDGTRLAATDGYVTRVRSLAGKELWSFQSHPRPKGESVARRIAPAWSPDGKWLAVPSKGQDSGAWGVSLSPKGEGAPTRVLTGPKAPVTCVAWAPDGSFFVAGDEDGTVIAWDAKTDKEIWRRTFHGRDMPAGRVHALAVSPADGTVAAAVDMLSGMCPQRVVLLAPRDGEAVASGLWRMAPVTSVAWAPDGRSFVAGYGVSEFERLPAGGGAGAVVVWGRKP